MRPTRALTLATSAGLVLVGLAAPALAESTSASDVSWSALDPGSDWSATVLKSLFPIPGYSGAANTGNEATVIAQIVGQFTGFIGAIACAFVCYNVIVHIVRAAESSQILGSGQSWMSVLRIGFAAVMMFPVGSGFSVGQQFVMQCALWGAGMAKALYANAVNAVGPDAAVIATPMVPGTQTVVAGLIANELCMDLINLASGTATSGNPLVPTPAAIRGTGNTVSVSNDGVAIAASTSPYMTYRYGFSTGNASGEPVCGSVSLRQPGTSPSTIAGVTGDMASVQSAVLSSVLGGSIRSGVASVAQNLWTTKNASALNPLQDIYTQAVQNYARGLTAAASSVQQNVNSALSSNAARARNGTLDVNASAAQQSTAGWTSAGAYYLEIARANAATLSLMTSVPVVTPPSWQGLPRSLAYDLAPFQAQVTAYLNTLRTIVNSQDGVSEPSGSPSTLAAAQEQPDGLGLLDKLFSQLQLNGQSVNKLLAVFNQTNAQVWTDPFGGLMALGQTLLVIGLSGLGIAAVLASPTASGAVALWDMVTLNWGGAAATVVGHTVVSFLATPIFMLMLACMVPGIIISYVLPMIPYVFWMAGVCGWIILVCEAMIAVPLWMLAHMTVSGEGMHGRAVEGWGLLFNVLFRPVLMLLGLFLSYFVFDCMSWLIRQSFGIAAGFVLANGTVVTNWIGVLVLMNIFVMTQVTAAFMSFRMIALLPHHLPRLLGFSSGNRVDTEAFTREAAWATGSLMAASIGRRLAGGLGDYGKAVQNGARPPSVRRLSPPAAAGSERDSMDTTLRATTNSDGPGRASS